MMVRYVLLLLIFCLLNEVVFVDGRRGRGRSRSRDEDTFSGGSGGSSGVQRNYQLKGQAVDLRNLDNQNGKSFLTSEERKAVNTVIHFHDQNNRNKEIPKWAKDGVDNAMLRGGRNL
jgi:hypothetical protein